MDKLSLAQELKGNSYPGRGIVIGRTPEGTKAVMAYFIMGRSENSRNRIFVEDGEGIRTQAFDPARFARSESYYLCASASVRQQDDCDKWRSDRYDLRRNG